MDNIPTHVAVILDGNRRWAKKHGKMSLDGHKMGMKNLISLTEHAFKRGIKVFSVYAFSTENFSRSQEEVRYLMDLFIVNAKSNLERLIKNDIRVTFSGTSEGLTKKIKDVISSLEEKSIDNKSGIFNVCFNYGGRAEIVDATKKILLDNVDVNDIDENVFQKYLYKDLPDVDLMIRPGGECRLSNFLLWQNSYAELYFSDVLFPDFNESELDRALEEFNRRNRRFGG